MKSKHGHYYNWKKDTVIDHSSRDGLFHLCAILPPHALASVLPKNVDLRRKMPPVYDQEQLGSCTANALTGAVQYVDIASPGSRLFLYYNERKLDNDIPDDAGSTLTQGVNALRKYGLCPESVWPYNISKFTTQPSPICYTQGAKHHVLSANRVSQDLNSLKTCLVSGFPFAFGISIYESFESDQVAQTGVVPMPSSNEQCLGGHAILAVGYDDTKRVFIIRNSWGTGWGDRGYFYLPYDYVTDVNLASDMWCITKVQA